MSDAAPNSDGMRFYVVCWMDVLNQRGPLQTWGAAARKLLDHTTSAEETECEKRIQSAAKSSVMRIEQLHRRAETHAETWKSGSQGYQPPAHATPEQAEQLRLLRSSEIRTFFFGDTIVVYAPVRGEEHAVLMRDIYAVIQFATSMMVAALEYKLAVRGCVEVGHAVQLRSGGLYGPVLLEALELESKIAKVPRVVVGPNIRKLLLSLIKPTPTTGLQRQMHADVEQCIQLLYLDDVSGERVPQYIVDYLGEHNAAKTTVPEIDTLLSNAVRWSDEQVNCFRSTNVEIAEKYAYLSKYINSRRRWWGSANKKQ